MSLSNRYWTSANARRVVTAAVLVTVGAGHSNSAPALTYRQPITIFKGGVYRGNWESQNARIPAVTISTAQPVTIEYSNIRSRGVLIYSAFKKANITVRNTRGEALNPGRPLKEYRTPGRFVHLEEFRSAVIENNEMVGTSGIYLRDYKGLPQLGQTIKIRRNKARNIDGRYSTGLNKFSDTEFFLVQFVQFNKVRNIKNAEISWNEIVNEPGKSRTEEVVNMFLSSGTPTSPIEIHDNYIQGAYNVNPTRTSYGGAGINMGDGSAKRPDEASSFIQAYNNQIIGTTTGIALSAGHDLLAYNNRLISSGYLPDGRPIYSQNVGIYVWDFYKNKKFGTFYNVVARNNTIGWATPLKKVGSQNPVWFPDCARDAKGKSRCLNNIFLPSPITLRMERDEYRRWLSKLQSAKIRIGVLTR